MVPRDITSENVEVIKREEITLFRQHVRVLNQTAVPDTLADIARTMRTGRGTGSMEVMWNQGGCKAIVTEQVTAREVPQDNVLTPPTT